MKGSLTDNDVHFVLRVMVLQVMQNFMNTGFACVKVRQTAGG